jgi:hypothetical protein
MKYYAYGKDFVNYERKNETWSKEQLRFFKECTFVIGGNF